jgi:hypothetical protein
VINLPIAKHHALTGATLGFKNWYGILGGERNRLHQQIHQSLVDLAAFMLPTLTLLDCYRVLLRNGPTGGNLEDVALHKTLVAGTDPVALDAYVAKAYWNLDAEAMPYRILRRCARSSARLRESGAGAALGRNPARHRIYFAKGLVVRRLFATIGAWLLHGGKKKLSTFSATSRRRTASRLRMRRSRTDWASPRWQPFTNM